MERATLDAKKIRPFSCAVDVWASGVLAYELVCGRPPFEVEDEVRVWACVQGVMGQKGGRKKRDCCGRGTTFVHGVCDYGGVGVQGSC